MLYAILDSYIPFPLHHYERKIAKENEARVHTSKSGFTQYSNATNPTKISPNKTTVKTCMTANKIEISRVVRRTLNPAATSGVTCSKAALIWRE
jgi:hypothetical protein